MPTYALLATQCPPVIEPDGTLDPTADPPVPVVFDDVVAGSSGSGSLSTPFNANAVRGDMLGRYGGGGYAVCEGLGITDSGTALTITVAAGTYMCDGPIRFAGDNLALTDEAYNYVYLTRAGTLTHDTSVDENAPPTLPASSVYLGRVEIAGSVILSIDYSGRFELKGGMLWRKTGDAAVPGDTPPSTVQFLSRSQSNSYFWDGDSYQAMTAQPVAVSKVHFTDEDYSIPDDYQAHIIDELVLEGTSTFIIADDGELIIEDLDSSNLRRIVSIGFGLDNDSVLTWQQANLLRGDDFELRMQRDNADDEAFSALVAGDTALRYQRDANGKEWLGPGNAPVDTWRERSDVAQYQTNAGTRHQMATGTTMVSASLVAGSDSAYRYQRDASGKEVFGDGTNPADITRERLSAGVMKYTGKVVVTAGIGVGNSAVATTPGTVTRRMEVFDAAGASLGFVPIYDAIA